MSSAEALTWFARHEIRLAWREWLAMMTGGGRKRKRAVIGLIIFAAVLHLPAYAVIGRFADLRMPLDKSSLIVITATIFLAWALMLSQAIESVTRVFYARADLDLIMSSPVLLTNVFSVRIAAIALSVTAMALLLSTPFVDVLVIGGGSRWLSAYGVVVAIGLSAAAVAIAFTLVLFRLIGPGWSRKSSQRSSAPALSSRCRSPRSCPMARCRASRSSPRMPRRPGRPTPTASSGGRRVRHLATARPCFSCCPLA